MSLGYVVVVKDHGRPLEDTLVLVLRRSLQRLPLTNVWLPEPANIAKLKVCKAFFRDDHSDRSNVHHSEDM